MYMYTNTLTLHSHSLSNAYTHSVITVLIRSEVYPITGYLYGLLHFLPVVIRNHGPRPIPPKVQFYSVLRYLLSLFQYLDMVFFII